MTNEYISYYKFVKSNDKKSIFSNPGTEQLVNAIAGNEKMKKFNFASKEEEKVAKIYMRMFFALAVIRLCRGESLGVARQKSLEQMNEYIKTKEHSSDPTSKYLLKFKEQFHPEIAKINMKDQENSKKKLKIDAGLAKQLEQAFAKEFKQCLKALDEMSQKNTMETVLGKTSTEIKNANSYPRLGNFEQGKQNAQKLLQQVLVQHVMNQRAA